MSYIRLNERRLQVNLGHSELEKHVKSGNLADSYIGIKLMLGTYYFHAESGIAFYDNGKDREVLLTEVDYLSVMIDKIVARIYERIDFIGKYKKGRDCLEFFHYDLYKDEINRTFLFDRKSKRGVLNIENSIYNISVLMYNINDDDFSGSAIDNMYRILLIETNVN